MQLLSDRLLLREFAVNDWKDLYEYLSDESVVKYEPYDVFTETMCRQEASRRSQDSAFWAVCLLGSNKMIGNLYFQRQNPEEFRTWEIGYVFNPKYYGNGFATEACHRILQYAFEDREAHRIIGLCSPENTASWRLMERLHMRREGFFKKPAFFSKDRDGKPIWHDAYQYSMLEEEWFSHKTGHAE